MSSCTTSAWAFAPRWREKLVCRSAEGELHVKLTMGALLHVHFPTREGWDVQAPGWAKARREDLLAELRRWCDDNGIPLSVEPAARVDEHAPEQPPLERASPSTTFL